MADHRPARQSDRDSATRRVEAAWAAGQIVEADRDHRIDQLRTARTMAEVDQVVHGLRPASYEVASSGPLGPELPHSGTRRRVLGGVAIGAVALLAGAGILVGALQGEPESVATGPAPVESVAPAPEEPPAQDPEPVPVEEPDVDPRTASGFAEMLADLEAATGRTDVFYASLHDGYAHLEAAVDGRSQRQLGFSWRDGFDEQGRPGQSPYDRVELRDVDMRVVERMLRRTARLVEDPTSRYVIIRAGWQSGELEILAYATNEWKETAYLAFEADGTIIRRVLP